MKLIKILTVVSCSLALLAGPVLAADKAPAKAVEKTCCEKADALGKDCDHKCCISAHADGKSCEKCNAEKQDLKILEKRKAAKKEEPKK